MSNAPKTLILLVVSAGLAACHGGQPEQNSTDNMAINNDLVGVPRGGAPADVDTLPADESSATPSNQLVNGDDSPDVNGAGTDNKLGEVR